MPSQKSAKIVNAFQRYTTQRNEFLIEKFDIEELEKAAGEYFEDRVHPYYEFLTQRISELKEKETLKELIEKEMTNGVNNKQPKKNKKQYVFWLLAVLAAGIIFSDDIVSAIENFYERYKNLREPKDTPVLVDKTKKEYQSRKH